jgi:peptide/nickel transport system substrate-binding protein
MNITTLDTTTAFDKMIGGSFEATYMSWELDPDPDPFTVFHSSQFPPAGFNFVRYSNPEADRLIEAGRRELDIGKRTEIYHRLHEVLAADQPYGWTVQASSKWALNKRLRGVRESRGYGLMLWFPGELDWWLAS